MIARFHYDRQTLAQFLDNKEEQGSADIANHIENCEECQAALESLLDDGLTMGAAGDLLRDADAGVAQSVPPRGPHELDLPTAFLEPSAQPGSLGKFARYEVVEILGRGGMGIVMRAYDAALERYCAVKVLAPELVHSAAARKRFSREAKSAAAVVHPHIVPIQTVDEHRGLPFLVMPVIDGQSLQQRMDRTGPLEVVEVVRIALQIADGLAAAHAHGLVHRDIKPANILLENGVERVQITDFGLARAIDDASLTRSGVISGTPPYMSPEQAHGDDIDHRSDLFSLGSVMFCMLAGHSPFRAETTMGVLNRIANEEPRRLQTIAAEVPEWLETIIVRLLEKHREDRFQTSAELIGCLEPWLSHLQSPDTTPAPCIVSRTKRQAASNGLTSKRQGRWSTALGLGGLAIGVAFLIYFAICGGMHQLVSQADTRVLRAQNSVEESVGGALQVPAAPKEKPKVSRSAAVLLAVNEQSAYHLRDGHSLEWIPSTHTTERPQGAHIDSHGHIFEQDQDTIRLKLQGMGEPTELHNIVFMLLRTFPCDMTGSERLWSTQITGDFVVGKDATKDQILQDLNRIMQDEMRIGIRLEYSQVERDVWLIEGDLEPTPRGMQWRRPEDRAFLLYSHNNEGAYTFNAGTFEDVLKAFGSRTGRPVINQLASTPPGSYGWQVFYEPSMASWLFVDPDQAGEELVRENFIAQTGLTVRSGRKRVELLEPILEDTEPRPNP